MLFIQEKEAEAISLNNLYDIMVELEEKIEDTKLRRKSVDRDAITLGNMFYKLIS